MHTTTLFIYKAFIQHEPFPYLHLHLLLCCYLLYLICLPFEHHLVIRRPLPLLLLLSFALIHLHLSFSAFFQQLIFDMLLYIQMVIDNFL